MIYVLLLEMGKYYVGYTARENGERFLEHFDDQGSQWTRKYKPLQVLEIVPGGLEDENEKTLEYMEEFGWWNVRGGSWCQVDLEKCPQALLRRQNLPLPPKVNRNIARLNRTMVCKRCHRTSHKTRDCYAVTNTRGDLLDDNRKAFNRKRVVRNQSMERNLVRTDRTNTSSSQTDHIRSKRIKRFETVQRNKSQTKLNPKRHTLHSHFESVEYNNFGFDDQIQIVHKDEHQDVEVISSDIEPGLLDMLAQAERDHNSLAVSPVQSFDTCYSDPEFDQELGNFDWNDCLENMAYLSSQNMLDVEDLEYFSAYSEVDSDGDADMHSDWGSEIDASLETIGGLLYDHGELELDSYSD